MIPCVLVPLALKLEADEPTPGFQPTIVPSSVTKRKTAEADVATPFLSTPAILNPPLSILKTAPVGVPLLPTSFVPGAGMLTTRGLMLTEFGVLPDTLWSVASLAPLSETQKGLPTGCAGVLGLEVRPHGFSKCGSTSAAGTICTWPFLSVSGVLLAIRSVSTKPPVLTAAGVPKYEATNRATSAVASVERRIVASLNE